MEKIPELESPQAIFRDTDNPVIVLSREGTILDFNPMAKSFLGFTTEKYAGRKLDCIYTECSDELIKWIKALKKCHQITLCGSLKDSAGEIFKAEIQLFYECSLGRDIIYAINRIIIDKNAVCRAKKNIEANCQIDLFFNEAIDLLCIMDFDALTVRLSQSWEAKLGWTMEEIMQRKTMRAFEYYEDKEETDKAFQSAIKNGGITGFRNRYITKSGNIITLDWNVRAVPEKKLVVATARDVTREILMEEKAKQLEQAVQNEYMKMQFFCNMSHEFRTPISIILATANLIKHGLQREIPDRINKEYATRKHMEITHKYMSSIEKNCFRLLKLVNNIIDVTKIDTGYFELHLRNSNIVKLIENVTMSTYDFMRSKDLNLIFETNVRKKMTLCDCDVLERIMLNLLSNAAKFTPKGGEIKVKVTSNNKKVAISVADNGIGIKKELQSVIFERFRQVDDIMTRSHEGSGIGLSLVKSLVELHKGTISVISEPNFGSEFIIELPILKGSAEKPINLFEDTYANAKIEFSDLN